MCSPLRLCVVEACGGAHKARILRLRWRKVSSRVGYIPAQDADSHLLVCFFADLKDVPTFVGIRSYPIYRDFAEFSVAAHDAGRPDGVDCGERGATDGGGEDRGVAGGVWVGSTVGGAVCAVFGKFVERGFGTVVPV